MAIASAQIESLIRKTELLSAKGMGILAKRMKKRYKKDILAEGKTNRIKEHLYEGGPSTTFARGEGGTWGANVTQAPVIMDFALVDLWFPFKVTGLQKRHEVLLGGDRDINHQLAIGMGNAQFDMGRILYGDGYGLLATVPTTAGTVNSFVVSSVKNLRLNQKIDCYDPTGVTPRFTNRKITAIVPSTRTITIDGATVSVTAGDEIFIYGNRNIEPIGILALVNDGSTMPGTKGTATIGGLTRSISHPLYDAYINRDPEGVERELTLELLHSTLAGIYEREVPGTDITAAYAGRGTAEAYLALIENKRQYVGNDIKVDYGGGKVAIYPPIFSPETGGAIPLITDHRLEEGMILFVSENDIKYHGTGDFQFKPGPTDKYFFDLALSNDEDAYKAVLHQEMQITGNPAKHGALVDIKPRWNRQGSITG